MQRIIEGQNNRNLVLTDLAKEYNVSDEYDTLVLIDIQNSRGTLLATMTCEKQRLKDVVALLE